MTFFHFFVWILVTQFLCGAFLLMEKHNYIVSYFLFPMHIIEIWGGGWLLAYSGRIPRQTAIDIITES